MLTRTMTNDDFATATKLIASGDGDEATALCVRLWLAERNESDAVALTRTLLPKLFKNHPASRRHFTSVRDEHSSRLDDAMIRTRWLQLNEALGDGATVIKWLDDVAPGSSETHLVAFDTHMQKIVEDQRAWPSLARHVNADQAEELAKLIIHDASRAVPKHELASSVQFTLSAKFTTARRALREVGRTEDDAKLGQLIERPVELH